MANDSANPILIAGAIGTVCLLGVAWMFAAGASNQAVVDAAEYAEQLKSSDVDANFVAKVESSEGKDPVVDKPVAALQEDDKGAVPAETEVAKTEDAPKADQAEAAKADEDAKAAEAAKADEDAKVAEAAKADEEAAAAEKAKADEDAKAAEAAKADEDAKVAEAAKADEEAAAAGKAKADENAKAAEAAKAGEDAKVAEAAKADEDAAAAEKAKADEDAKAAEAAKAEETETAEAAATAAAPAAVETASVDGDAAAGKKVFRKCKACHQVGAKAKNRVGPQLNDIVGRTMGSVEDFKYSDVFKAAMDEGKVWTVADLDAWLKKPKDFMPGNKMAFPGLRKDKDRANVIAYLASGGE